MQAACESLPRTRADATIAQGRNASIDTRPTLIRMASASLRVIDSLAAVAPAAWDALVGDAPLLSHAFLHALHETGCASPATGWTPRYLTAWQSRVLVGAMPLYVKSHSYGEYVFD